MKSFRSTKSFTSLTDSVAGNSAKDWYQIYHENPRLSVVHKISEDNGSTGFHIEKVNSDGSKVKIANHPLEKALKEHSIPQFFALWTAYRLMAGKVYIAYDLDEQANPVNFKIFTKKQLVNSNSNVYSFNMGDGTQVSYPKDRVIVDIDPDLTKPYAEGRGKAEAIKDEIETDELVQKYIKYFYINSARPDVYVTASSGDEMTEEDVKRIESKWLQKFQGINNAHKPVFLNWDAKVFSVPNNHKDMELLDTRRFYRDTTIQHFGVPPEIMGIVENSNKATVIAAEHIYAKQVRLPLLEHFERIVTQFLMPRFPDSEGMTFRFENILPDDVELALKVASEGIKVGTLTINEWRIAMGYPRLSDDIGNSLLIPSNKVLEIVKPESSEIETVEYKAVRSSKFKEQAKSFLGVDLPDSFEIVEVQNE